MLVVDEEKNSRAVRKKRTNQSSTAVIFSSSDARAMKDGKKNHERAVTFPQLPNQREDKI